MRPLISIIIPVYNVQDYLPDCLDSVSKQTFTQYELICINDGSTDTSLNILNKFAEQNPRLIIINQVNKGLAITRNIGMKFANGKYIFFLDSDDKLNNPYVLEQLFERSCKTNVDICYGQTNVFIDNNFTTDSSLHIQKLKQALFQKTIYKFQVSMLNFFSSVLSFSALAQGKLYKKSFIDKNNIVFIEAKKYHEDIGFHLKIMACGPSISILPFTIFDYRRRSGSITSNNSTHTNDLRIILYDSIAWFKANIKYSFFYVIQTYIMYNEYISPPFCKYFLKTLYNTQRALKYMNKKFSNLFFLHK